jgi:outer membrane protein assembly factor BamB
MRWKYLLIGCLAAILAMQNIARADWTRFRGPNGTGASTDKGVPVTWTDKEVLWKSELPGGGHSSPIVVKGKVFLQAATRSDRLLVCFDATSGKQLWSKAVPGGVGKMHPKSSLASGTPCSDGQKVYCVFWDGKRVGLFAFDFAGKLVWNRDLGDFKSQHGPGFSPIVHDGKVIVNNDQDGKATLQAFHAKDGEPAWEVKRVPHRACYSTPFLYEQGTNGQELVVTSTTAITRYDPSNGKELWSFTWTHPVKPLRTVGSSVAADGLVFAASGDGDGSRGMIAVKLDGKGDVSKTNLVWAKDSSTPYVPCALAHNGHLYTIHDDGVAYCWEMKTGKEVWRARLGELVSSSPVLIDGKVYAVGEKGNVYVWQATPDGYKLLAKNSLGERTFSTPAVANGRLYIRGAKHLFCIGKPAQGLRGKALRNEEAKKVDNRVFELRIYHAAPGKMKALHSRFRDTTCALFKKHGMTIVAFWSPIDEKEAEKKLYYILAYPNKDAARKSWEAFREDPVWVKAKDESEKGGKLVDKVESVYLNPTDYSPMK